MHLYHALLLAFLALSLATWCVPPAPGRYLGTAALLAFAAYNLGLPSGMNIRIDLLVTVPMVIGVVIRLWYRSKARRHDRNP